jgi:PAS domain S-box-containing protein
MRLKAKLLLIGGLLFVLILLTSGAAYLYVKQHKLSEAAVNVAGRQRMLSQRITKEALNIHYQKIIGGEPDNSLKLKLENDLSLFEASHRALVSRSEEMGLPPTTEPAILAQLTRVKGIWDEFARNARVILRGDQESPAYQEAMAFLLANNETLLTEMDRAVKMYVEETGRRISRLLWKLKIVILMGVIGMVVWWFSIRKWIEIPIVELREGTEIIGQGNLDYRLEVKTRDEIGFLADSFNAMAENLIATTASRDELQREVAERVRAEEALRESEAALRTIIDTAVDGIITCSEEEIVQSFNPAAERLFGYTADEVIGQNVKMLMPSPYRENHHKYVENYKKTGVKKIIGSGRELVGQRKDGTIFPMYLAVSEWRHGDERRFTAIVHDLTEQKRAEEELGKLSQAVEQSSSTVIITDCKGKIEYVNPKFTQLTGYTPEEAMGQNAGILKSGHTPQEVYDRLWDTITSGREWKGEFLNKKKDGELFWESASIAPVIDPQGVITHFIAVKEDITERKRAEEALRKAHDELEQRVEERTAELVAANERLKAEIDERKRAEEELHESHRHLERQNQVIQELTRKITQHDNLKVALREITEAAANTLQVERASVWFYNDDCSKIKCIDLYEKSVDRHTEGNELSISDYPAYFEALKSERTITAHDAYADPRTKEFSESYLSPIGITSMMDAPIRLHDRGVGVICHEHVGPPRRWKPEEENFAGSMADLISLEMERFERRRAEEELTRVAEEHRKLIETAHALIFSVDTNGMITQWSHRAENITGYSEEEVMGRNLVEVFITQDYQNLVRNVLTKTLKGVDTANFEFPFYTRGGERMMLMMNATPIRGSDGNITGVLCVALVVTELWEYRENLEQRVEERTRELNRALYDTEEARDRIDAILKSVADGLIVTDIYNRVILMNRAAEDMLGVRLSEVMDRPIDFAIEDNTLRERIRTTLDEKVTGYEFDFTLPSEEPEHPRIIHARTSVIEEKSGKVNGIIPSCTM